VIEPNRELARGARAVPDRCQFTFCDIASTIEAAPAFAPMLATSGAMPPDDGRWACEVKWDGWRALVTIDGAVTIHTRRGRNATSSFPELAGLADSLGGRRVILDREVVAAVMA
jgi:bifunctional non-homologous end joining protein LigD